jgi:hypothetical protein
VPGVTTVNIDAPPEGPLAGAYMKLAWAQHHRQTLLGLMQAFAEDPPEMMTLRKKLDPDAGLWSLSVDTVAALPGRWSLYLGDFLTNARAAVDYAAWELVRAGSVPSPTSPQSVAFTVEDREFGAKRSFAANIDRQMPGIRPDHLDVVKSFQPFRMGDELHRHPLGILKRLSNIDKHRQLHLTVPYANGSVEFSARSQDFAMSSYEEGRDLKKCIYEGFFAGAEVFRVRGSVTGPNPEVTGSLSGQSVFMVREDDHFWLVEELLLSIVDRVGSLLFALKPLLEDG